MTYTDATNAKRAAWAEAALYLFRQLTGSAHEDALGDLLCDLMHWAEREGFDFDLALSRAKGHFEEESAEEEAVAVTAAAPTLHEALIDITGLAQKRGDNAYLLLERIEQKALEALAQTKEAGQ